ncbi:hypothetical protein LCGC14_0570530 [marine sediment metagenome]|uniref:Uncharacterized protein n=1 Tax=marine sediment metagenome TaxID=412755 RepID=A0A0F9U5Q8_9ZZZZ
MADIIQDQLRFLRYEMKETNKILLKIAVAFEKGNEILEKQLELLPIEYKEYTGGTESKDWINCGKICDCKE